MGTTSQSAHAAEQRQKFAQIPTGFSGDIRKLTFKIEDKAGVVFVSNAEFPELFVVVNDRNGILPALDEALHTLLGDGNFGVRVYMNCQKSGPSIDAMVEIRPHASR